VGAVVKQIAPTFRQPPQPTAICSAVGGGRVGRLSWWSYYRLTGRPR